MFEQKNTGPSSKLRLSIDYRIISLVLLIALAICVFMWKPWVSPAPSDRKITVNGQATIKAVPDQYLLSPYFEFDSADRTKATADATTKAKQISEKLKEIGVKDTEIKSNTNSYDKYMPVIAEGGTNPSVQLSYTITLSSKDTAQKVQDYFLGLNAKGQISPQATFSESKQKTLEASARDNAIADAKSKASKTAEQLGSKIGKVITISDDSTGVNPCGRKGLCPVSMMSADESAKSSIPIQAGENEFTASVQVVYELR